MNQHELNDLFSEFRIPREDAIYPPYHKGQYLEEYFVSKYLDDADQIKSKNLFLPIHWTAVFNFKANKGLQPGTANHNLRTKLFKVISKLPQDLSYFTVSTHDDAPMGNFPPNTRHFYAGGNSPIGTDPIPLVCSEINYNHDPQKMIFCSFVGSATNQIRNKALQYFHSKPGYSVSAFHWKPDVSIDQQKLFIDQTSRSRFTLCPRGYGATSYRLYEAMQLGSIPVYISDKLMLPWVEEIDWDTFCVVTQISNAIEYNDTFDILDHYLRNITETKVRSMQEKIKEIYPLYFTIPAVYNQIIKRIK